MILQELVNYYDRSDEVAPAGWERKRIPFLIEVAEDGRFVQLMTDWVALPSSKKYSP